jgi:hypothetical protein
MSRFHDREPLAASQDPKGSVPCCRRPQSSQQRQVDALRTQRADSEPRSCLLTGPGLQSLVNPCFPDPACEKKRKIPSRSGSSVGFSRRDPVEESQGFPLVPHMSGSAGRFTPVGTVVSGVPLALFGSRAVKGYFQNVDVPPRIKGKVVSPFNDIRSSLPSTTSLHGDTRPAPARDATLLTRPPDPRIKKKTDPTYVEVDLSASGRLATSRRCGGGAFSLRVGGYCVGTHTRECMIVSICIERSDYSTGR